MINRRPLFEIEQTLPEWKSSYIGIKLYVKDTKLWYIGGASGWETQPSVESSKPKIESLTPMIVAVENPGMAKYVANNKVHLNIVNDDSFKSQIQNNIAPIFDTTSSEVSSDKKKINFHVTGPEADVSHLITIPELQHLASYVRGNISIHHADFARPIGLLYGGMNYAYTPRDNFVNLDFTLAAEYRLRTLPWPAGTHATVGIPAMSGNFGFMFQQDNSSAFKINYTWGDFSLVAFTPPPILPLQTFMERNSKWPGQVYDHSITCHAFAKGIWYKIFSENWWNATWITNTSYTFGEGYAGYGTQGLGNDYIGLIFECRANSWLNSNWSVDRLHIFNYSNNSFSANDLFTYNLEYNYVGLAENNSRGYLFGSNGDYDKPTTTTLTHVVVNFNGDQLVSVQNAQFMPQDYPKGHTLSTQTHGVIVGGDDSMGGVIPWVQKFDFATWTNYFLPNLYEERAWGQMCTAH